MTGLTSAQAAELLKTHGPNVISTKRFTVFTLLLNQFKNPILILLAGAAIIAGALGDAGNAITIGVILTLSVVLSLSTEYRAQKAAEDLKARATRKATVLRDGVFSQIDVAQLVPGDVVALTLGSIVPADLTLDTVEDLECDESIISGESLPVTKMVGDTALMGTVVRAGSATATVARTGGQTEFGIIAERLSEQAPQTDFQRGLHRFSLFLLWIALIQGVVVIGVSALLGHNLINAVLFALALAVGMTPQLLPAVVSTALALGSKHLAKNGVLVKRLVSIEDLGDIDVLVTDKTGTLTAGAVAYTDALQFGTLDPVLLGLLATDANYADAAKSTAGLNPLDAALWNKNGKLAEDASRLDAIPFDHNRRIASALVVIQDQPVLVSKGSPEDLLSRCANVAPEACQKLDELYEAGSRVIAVATKGMPGASGIKPSDESNLTFEGFLTFADPAKPDVADSLKALAALGISVKICTGDSAQVAATVCRQVGLVVAGALTGGEIDALSDAELVTKVTSTTVFARVSPEQKARILRSLRSSGVSVGFLGDGVNDAIALHDADVGISVDTATDVAKDAADVVLLEKDLGVLATGVRQGRQVFSNTMKYVLMGTAGDFGNMVSAGIGAMILPFLPMLPSQLLLQDLMYDSSQLGIPSDNVDPEQTARPSHWSIKFIGRFMVIFGLASSIFDFATFGLMTWVFHAKAAEFQTGWFMESLATATLIVFAVRTRRVPFWRSHPSKTLLASVGVIVLLGAAITYSPVGALLGFAALPLPFFVALLGMIAGYLVVVEVAKLRLFALQR